MFTQKSLIFNVQFVTVLQRLLGSSGTFIQRIEGLSGNEQTAIS